MTYDAMAATLTLGGRSGGGAGARRRSKHAVVHSRRRSATSNHKLLRFDKILAVPQGPSFPESDIDDSQSPKSMVS